MPGKAKTQNSKLETNNFFVSLCLCGCVILFSGCEEKKKDKLQTSKQEKPALSESAVKRENRELKAQNNQLKEQIETLIGIDKPARIEAVSTLSSIEITNRSGIAQKANPPKGPASLRRVEAGEVSPQAEDGNGISPKTLVVYLRTIDDMGDVIKAPGAVKVELWDLNKKPNEALLGDWQVEPKDLKKMWSGSLLTSYYKMRFDVNSVLNGKEKELTLKVEFTDYLTGKVLKGQKVIK